jgi:hypothetical protein
MDGIRDGYRSGGDALAGKERRMQLRDVESGDVDAMCECVRSGHDG